MAIAAIMNDTREVANMLAAAMQAEAGDVQATPGRPHGAHVVGTTEIPPAAATVDGVVLLVADGPDVAKTADPTLPARYAVLYQLLLARGDWTVSEAEATARQHGHMLSGAIEALNDWAFEKYGGQLFVEDGNRLLVERSLLS